MSELENDSVTSNAVEGISRTYGLLLRQGQHVLNCIRAGNLQIDVHAWIVEAADHIIPIMPFDIPEYQQINDIRKLYHDSQILIPGRVLSDVSTVCENLRTAYKCFRFGVIGVPERIPPENLAAIAFDLIRRTRDYVRGNIVQRLIGKENGRTRRTALLHSYGRIYCLVESITKLDGLCDFLSVAGCTRAILEVFVDMYFLCPACPHLS